MLVIVSNKTGKSQPFGNLQFMQESRNEGSNNEGHKVGIMGITNREINPAGYGKERIKEGLHKC